MHTSASLFSLLCALSAALAAPTSGLRSYEKRVVHRARSKPGRGFEPVAFAEQVKDDDALTMAVRLTQSNPQGLDAALAEISDPANPRYGQWLSREQITEFTKPTPETLDAVTKWLASKNVTAVQSELPEYLTFTVPVGQANTLLEAKYTAFVNTFSGNKIVRTLQFSLPEAMEAHILTVYPGTSFFNPSAMPINAVRAPAPAAVVDDSDLIRVLVARTNETRVITTAQLKVLWDAVQKQQAKSKKSLPSPAKRSPIASPAPPSVNSTLLVSSIGARSIIERQQSPEDILNQLNQTLGGTLPTGTRIVQVPENGDLSGLDPTLADIVRGILSAQGGGSATQVPVPVPSSPVPVPTSTSSSTVSVPPTTQTPPSTTSTSTSTSSTQPPVQQPSSVPIPVPTLGVADASCANEITPACLAQLYAIPSGLNATGPVGIAVTGYIDQFGQQDDLREFLAKFRTDADASTTFETVSISGGENPQGTDKAGVEANLDLQYTIGVTPGVPVQFVTVGKSGTGNGFLDTITTMIAQDKVPEVVTTSYGQDEADIDADVAEAMCNAYQQLTARGVSILFASGDSGVGDFANECAEDGIFHPTFPSGCPFITSVGSTDGVAPERAASFSSGGFSNLYPAPAYQAQHVAKYLADHAGLHAGKFNAAGRAFPDISVQGTKFAVIHAGEKIGVQGTSASCPVFASMIALINAERAALNRPPMGFLNPWIYGVAAPAFVDVVDGSNPGCGSEGFPASAGWDPVTGMGTPNYASLRAAAGLA